MTRGDNGLILVQGATYKECEYCGLEFEVFHNMVKYCPHCRPYREREKAMRHYGKVCYAGKKCEYCGRTFVHKKRGQQPKYCPSCRKQINRDRAREHYHSVVKPRALAKKQGESHRQDYDN